MNTSRFFHHWNHDAPVALGNAALGDSPDNLNGVLLFMSCPFIGSTSSRAIHRFSISSDPRIAMDKQFHEVSHRFTNLTKRKKVLRFQNHKFPIWSLMPSDAHINRVPRSLSQQPGTDENTLITSPILRGTFLNGIELSSPLSVSYWLIGESALRPGIVKTMGSDVCELKNCKGAKWTRTERRNDIYPCKIAFQCLVFGTQGKQRYWSRKWWILIARSNFILICVGIGFITQPSQVRQGHGQAIVKQFIMQIELSHVEGQLFATRCNLHTFCDNEWLVQFPNICRLLENRLDGYCKKRRKVLRLRRLEAIVRSAHLFGKKITGKVSYHLVSGMTIKEEKEKLVIA
jgi:hypothetical protein